MEIRRILMHCEPEPAS